MTTVQSLVESVADRFGAAGLVFGHGTDSAWDEAVALVLGVTGLPDDRASLVESIPTEQVALIEDLARQRIEDRVPLPYLLGRCQWAGVEFLIEPGVVIPRSPLGGLLHEELSPWLTTEPRAILDVCCGSGCIGILAALVFPEAEVTLVDIDPQALDLARRNVLLHDLGDRVRVVRSDLLDDLAAGSRYDVILSNPPYVDAIDMAALPAEYRHEPVLGLAAGSDGLVLVNRMLESIADRLAPGGVFVCEVGASAPALLRRHPRLPFYWPELPTGGEGVFVLLGDELVATASE